MTVMELLLRRLSRSRGSKHAFLIVLVSSLVLTCCCLSTDDESVFVNDHLTPYTYHHTTRSSRDVSTCQQNPTVHVNTSIETFNVSTKAPFTTKTTYELHQFADAIQDGPLRRRYILGTIAYVNDPYFSLSVLEPNEKNGCKALYGSTKRSLVSETVSNRKNGCRLAINAGYFNMFNGECLGNVVSDGRLIQTAGSRRNANFGIRKDGTMVIGYLSEGDVCSTSNPFHQLVTGVIWLVRDGINYVNKSMILESSENEGTGKMETFVNVLSARTAVGFDKRGRLVLAQVLGQTHHRGANLYELADLLIKKGVTNAINLDGGGSATFLEDGVLRNFPSDHCPFQAQYRCARPVSTVLCVHDVQCLEQDCSSHGSCDQGRCSCDSPWIGEVCDRLNCSITNCTGHGRCDNVTGKCICEAGKTGDFCEKDCPVRRYGLNCQSVCYCYGRSHCDPVNGRCVCPSGRKGYGCFENCKEGYFGDGCTHKCRYPNCTEHGKCSPINGSCLCDEGWSGVGCESSLPLSPNISTAVMTTPTSTTMTTTSTQCITPTVQMISVVSSSESMIVYIVVTATLTLLLHLTLCVVTVSCVRGRDKAIRKRFNHILINTDSSSS